MEVPNKLLLLFRPPWPKREVFIWKKFHETPLLKEILLEEPYNFNPGTKERGTAWSHIADMHLEYTGNKGNTKVGARKVRQTLSRVQRKGKK